MIVITDVKYLEVPDKTYCEIISCRPQDKYKFLSVNENLSPKDFEIIYDREYIKGKHFIHPEKNVDVWIGITNEVSEILGKPFEIIDNLKRTNELMNNEIYILRKYNVEYNFTIKNLKKDLEHINNMKFFERLKFLFGNKNVLKTDKKIWRKKKK